MRDLVKHPLTPKEFDVYVENFEVVDVYKNKNKNSSSYRICSNQAGIESVEMFNEDLHVWSVVVLNTSPDIDISRESWKSHSDMYYDDNVS